MLYYSLKNNPNTFPTATITYKKGDIYTIQGTVRYILSDELIKQLDEATDTFYRNLNEVFTETNGYHIADFGNDRFIGYKQISPAFYHFIVIKKSDDNFTYLYQEFSCIQRFLDSFDFSHWGLIGSNLTKLKESVQPLYLSAKVSGDRFLEYEIKFLTFSATQSEIDFIGGPKYTFMYSFSIIGGSSIGGSSGVVGTSGVVEMSGVGSGLSLLPQPTKPNIPTKRTQEMIRNKTIFLKG